MDRQENDFNNAEERFDDLVRQSAPYVRPSDQHREMLRMILKHNISRHKLRNRLLTVTLAIIILAGGLFQLTDVGSDGFDLFPVTKSIRDLPVAETPFSGVRIGHPNRDLSFSQQDLDELRSVYEQKMSKQYDLIAVYAWTIRNSTSFILNWQAEVGGGPQSFSHMSLPSDRETGLQFGEFFANYENVFHERIKDGTARVIGRETIHMEGADILFTKWASSFPEWGEVIFWDGKPVR